MPFKILISRNADVGRPHLHPLLTSNVIFFRATIVPFRIFFSSPSTHRAWVTTPYEKDEKVPLQVAVAVMEAAGIASSVAIRLLKAVRERGKGVVMQGKEEDVKVMAALFAENGMKATVQQGSAPHALH